LSRIARGLKLIGDTEALMIEELDTLLIADLHIGYEQALEKSGVFLPRSQYPKLKRRILELLEDVKPRRLLIAGDVKHEFGEATAQEWLETLDLLDTLLERAKLTVVRGNHDNYLIPILKRKGIPLLDPVLAEEGYLIAHGHKPIPESRADVAIIAHEHPVLALRDEVGVKQRYRCLLKGRYEGRLLIVLPALSPLASGTEVNTTPRESFLSPDLAKAELREFEAIVQLSGKSYTFPLSALMPREP